MIKKLVLILLLFTCCLHAQHTTSIIATLNSEKDRLEINQTLEINNESDSTWDHIILLDWANAFSSKQTPLAVRFAEDFKNKFQFSNLEERGRTILKQSDSLNNKYFLERLSSQQDIIKLIFEEPLLAGENRTVQFNYTIKIPEDNFTEYGKNSKGEYNLKYWYLHPAPFINGKWEYYSHKDLDDFHGAPMNFSVSLHLPKSHRAVSNLTRKIEAPQYNGNSYLFTGTNYYEAVLHILNDVDVFKTYSVPGINIVTDIEDKSVPLEIKVVFNDRIASFLQNRLGGYPYDDLFVSDRYYRENPVYGLSSLPSFINPFPAGFTYEIKMLKALARKWVESGIHVNPREEAWIEKSLITYLMMEYQKTYYPDLKIGGKLSNIWGIRGFNAANLKFNDSYSLLYLNSARQNLDEAINTPADQLVKYNQQIGIPFKAAIGWRFLDDFLGDKSLEKSIQEFYVANHLQFTSAEDLQQILSNNSSKNIDWFFEDYITTHKRLDWTIRKVKKTDDSVSFEVKNKSHLQIPVPVYLLEEDSIVTKKWIEGIKSDSMISLSRKRATRIAINHEELISEFNPRDNYKTLKGFPSLNRPLEFRLFKDIEDPERSQVFLMPDVEFNIYDGLTLGTRFYNGNLLPKPLRYSIKPGYGTNSNKLVGSISMSYDHPIQDREERLFSVRYGISANTFSYADDLMFRRGSAWLQFRYRPEDLRSNKQQSLSFRNIYVDRDRNPLSPVDEPDYNVFAINFAQSDNNLRRVFNYNIGTEISSQFTKATYRFNWRRLYRNNRQLEFRFFGGAFLTNNSQSSGNFFSFALDRPTDYLFDYNYYGRSEDSGLFSQQLIVAEGGFKSQLEPAFANQWITTVNGSYSLWNYIHVYGDAGFVKNKGRDAKFVYDSGIRLNLLQDFFELYFPVYSNNGWEIAQQNYDEKIRFIVTLDINTFVKLFSRRWY
ncbi:hypothetical protein LX97_02530 [Nonlabens dokdonensis]|uniref:Aminopeptidase N n=2 Tax=Nonlabens dokdonensis TaxID=328515 RepID=L7WF06_NONDD|nr:aminopeptidase N [Nonlabens dokdonensis]AGC78709.1 aminopeptidase N [Nonlabens dokdonensis DSW-6]PZX39164.1 hypothetical protein LX97_02530 [Nonlabens dokdonensis]